MESDNSVKKLISILEPRISDLDVLKESLETEKNELENISRFLAYTKDNLEMVGIYADQELILKNLENINCSKEWYKASCYLLKSEDEKVKSLPQYKEACELFGNIIQFFKMNKADLVVGIEELNNECQNKEIEKKYHDLLLNNSPFIEDVSEFENLLNTHDLSDEDKINILFDIIKNNVENYESGIK